MSEEETSGGDDQDDHDNACLMLEDMEKRTEHVLMFSFFYTIMYIYGTHSVMTYAIFSVLEDSMKKSEEAKNRIVRVRTSWTKESARFSDRMFFPLFRLYRPGYNRLCTRIKMTVGERAFRSEDYIEELRAAGTMTPASRMYYASLHTTGEYISGEIKVCLTLRFLAGASYLDLYLWYNSSCDHILNIVREVIQKWFCNDSVMRINFYEDVLQNSARIERINRKFSISSGGWMKGCFGSIDGWLVKIRCPTLREVANPGKYMSRKGFFALNVQAIVDKDKKILWRFIGQKGSAHDSTVFKQSNLYNHLMLVADQLYEKELYIVGDSAYALRGFLLCPYENTRPNTPEDNFNFYLSSQRIHVECAFGEIDRRFGIFWRPLEGNLKNHQHTIDACLRLHNFILEFREEMKNNELGIDSEEFERRELDIQSDNFMRLNTGARLGAVGGDSVQNRGRTSANETVERDRGMEFRNKLRDTLAAAGMARPEKNRKLVRVDKNNRAVEEHDNV